MNVKHGTARTRGLSLFGGLLGSTLSLLFCFALVAGAAQPNRYRGKLGIEKAAHLSPEEREVEARFAAYLEANTDRAIARYHAKFGNEINTDNVRELSSDYAPGGINALDAATIAARTRWGEAVHEPASALTKEIYRRALRKRASSARRKQVVFTAGGAGAGKTTSIRALADLSHAVQLAEIVYDTTLSNLGSAIGRINEALHAGRLVSIVYVYRDPIDSLIDGILPRAQSMGRAVPLLVVLNTHLGSADTIVKIADRYKHDARVAVAIIDNRDGPGGAAPADLEFVRRMALKYSRPSLQAALSKALEDAYETDKKSGKNKISESLYRAIQRNVPTALH
jgi:hypothetical protein